MTDAEIDTLVSWVDAGAPRGAPEDLPEPIEYVEGWQIGVPDIIFELPEVVEVPASFFMTSISPASVCNLSRRRTSSSKCPEST